MAHEEAVLDGVGIFSGVVVVESGVVEWGVAGKWKGREEGLEVGLQSRVWSESFSGCAVFTEESRKIWWFNDREIEEGKREKEEEEVDGARGSVEEQEEENRLVCFFFFFLDKMG